jgi:hypothetical protein
MTIIFRRGGASDAGTGSGDNSTLQQRRHTGKSFRSRSSFRSST